VSRHVEVRRYSPSKDGIAVLGLASPTSQQILHPSIEQTAVAFFCNNFTYPGQDAHPRDGFINAVVDLYHHSVPGCALNLATRAVALVTISSLPAYRNVGELGQCLYVRALSATQSALRDQALATSDAALATVVLLSLWESATASDRSVDAWRQHIDGAVALVKARGEQQFTTSRGRGLFRAVRTELLLLSMQTSTGIETFPGPRGWMSDMTGDVDENAVNFLAMAIEATNLQDRAKRVLKQQLSAANTKVVEDILAQARALQCRQAQCERGLSEAWSPQTTAVSTCEPNLSNIEELKAWPGPMHSYRNVHVASTLNNHRVCSISCASIIQNAIRWLQPETYLQNPEYCSARSRIQHLVDDVCHSVPSQLAGRWLKKDDQMGRERASCKNKSLFAPHYFVTETTDSNRHAGSLLSHLASLCMLNCRRHPGSPDALASFTIACARTTDDITTYNDDGRGQSEVFG
jgi:hypothetical protein